MSAKPKVVILGAGFGGLWAARRLADKPVDILLIDKNNYHTFLPLLYQVAAAELEPERIAQPIRYLIRDEENINFRLGKVTAIDPVAQSVMINGDEAIPYDSLIVALGSRTAFFGVPGAAEHAFSLKSIDQAIDLRNHILTRLEKAVTEEDPQKRRAMLTFCIVGGGATGVEYAGALAELLYHPLQKDFPELDLKEMARVILIEAGSQLLRGVDTENGVYTSRRLAQIGVDVRVNTLVEAVEPDQIVIKGNEPILTDTVVWAAGVRGQPVAEMLGIEPDRGGQIPVNHLLQTEPYENIYVVGDLMRYVPNGEDSPLANTAQVAMQSGEQAADNILKGMTLADGAPFVYRDKGMMATIGRNAAVANIGGRHFTGFVAWWIWLLIHLYFLIGFRNRLGVLTNWAWNYLWYERVVRLIMPLEPAEEEIGRRP